jgi:hypothetical protein
MTDEPTSKTGESLDKPRKPGTFAKGYDPRRNLKGVPADAIAGRKAIRKIGAELLRIKEGGDEYEITRFEAMVRLMFSSRAPKDKETLLKALMPGLLKDELTIESKSQVTMIGVNAIDYRAGLADLAPRPIPDSDTSGEEENAGDGQTLGQDGAGRRIDT